MKGTRRIASVARAMTRLPTYAELLFAGELKSFRVPTDVTHEELLLLYRLAKTVRDGAIVEIGSYLGASACFMAAGGQKAGARVYCVDPWNNYGMSEGPRDTYQTFLRNTEHRKAVITPLRAWSLDAAADFHEPSIGLIFIDGDHSRDAVVADLRAWLPLVRAGGWVALHDSGWADGVQHAIATIVEPLTIGEPISLPNLYATRIDPSGVSASS